MNRKRVFVIVAGLSLMTGCDLLTSREQRLERAAQHLASGDYGDAQVEVRNLIAKQPEDPEALLLLARLGLQTGDIDGAWSALGRAEGSGADAGQVMALRARLLLLRGQPELLLQELEAGSSLNESEVELLRAQAQQATGRKAEAIAGFRAVLSSAPQDAHARVGLAELLLAEGQQEAARRLIEDGVARYPNSPELWVALGMMRLQAGQHPGAEESLRTALTHAPGRLPLPQHAGVIKTIADLRLTRNDVEGAQRLLADLVRLSPQNVMTQLVDGRVDLARDLPADATRKLQRLVNDAPQLAEARFALAAAHLADGKVEQAILTMQPFPDEAPFGSVKESVAAVAGTEPESADRWIATGIAQLALDQSAAARRALQRALDIESESLRAAAIIVTLDLRAGQLDTAANAAAELVSKFPQERSVHVLQGDVRMASRDYPGADAAYAAAFRMSPDAAVAMALSRARLAGDLPGATEPLAQVLAEQPDLTTLRFAYAQTLMTASEGAAAARQYERLLREAPNSVVAMNNLALLYQQAGDSRAVALAERAYRAAPHAAAVMDTYGWILLQRGRVAEALPLLEQARVAAPASAEIAYHHGVALARAGQDGPARGALEDALSQAGQFEGREAAQALLETLTAKDGTVGGAALR